MNHLSFYSVVCFSNLDGKLTIWNLDKKDRQDPEDILVLPHAIRDFFINGQEVILYSTNDQEISVHSWEPQLVTYVRPIATDLEVLRQTALEAYDKKLQQAPKDGKDQENPAPPPAPVEPPKPKIIQPFGDPLPSLPLGESGLPSILEKLYHILFTRGLLI